MIHLDAATLFVQWATGLLAWMVVESRRRLLAFDMTWVLRTAIVILLGFSVFSAMIGGFVVGRDVAVLVLLVAELAALAVSITTESKGRTPTLAPIGTAPGVDTPPPIDSMPALPMRLDLLAVVAGVVAIVGGALHDGGPAALAIARIVVGAAFLGGLTFAMLFGHRLLAKPHLGGATLHWATNGLLVVWPFEVVVMVLPTGMFSVFSGTINDGYGGILGWMWAGCAIATGVMLVMTKAILREGLRQSLSSATGIIYIAGLTGFGANLIARAVLAG